MDERQEESNSPNLDRIEETFAAVNTDVAKIPDVSMESEDSNLDRIQDNSEDAVDAGILKVEREVVGDKLEEDSDN